MGMSELSTLTTRSGFQGAKNLRALSLVALALLFLQAGKSRALDDAAAIELFEKKIRPVLVERCYKCHSAGSKKLKGKLRLDNREGLRREVNREPPSLPASRQRAWCFRR